MPEVFRYIFKNFETIDQVVRKQNRTNRNFTIVIVGLTVLVVSQAKKINELDYEVQKLKRNTTSTEAE